MEAKRVVKEMNQPQWIPVLGLPALVTVLSLGISLVLGLLYSWALACLLFLVVIFLGRWMNATDPKFIELLFLSLGLGTEYDPAFREDQRDFPAMD